MAPSSRRPGLTTSSASRPHPSIGRRSESVGRAKSSVGRTEENRLDPITAPSQASSFWTELGPLFVRICANTQVIASLFTISMDFMRSPDSETLHHVHAFITGPTRRRETATGRRRSIPVAIYDPVGRDPLHGPFLLYRPQPYSPSTLLRRSRGRGCASSFLIAGHETTDLIGNGLLALLENPHQLQRLKTNPTLIKASVEELLRYDSPVQRDWGVATEDIEIGGKRISEGQIVLQMLGAG